jgi:hypothetical protein
MNADFLDLTVPIIVKLFLKLILFFSKINARNANSRNLFDIMTDCLS